LPEVGTSTPSSLDPVGLPRVLAASNVSKMESVEVLRVFAQHGIPPSAQRVAVASWVLSSRAHPSADAVFAAVRGTLPVLSRATVYNTLHLLVDKRLLKQLVITEGRVVFDPVLTAHHHFVDDETGEIVDVPFDAVVAAQVKAIPGLAVREVQVVLRGRRAAAPTEP
jgi:Fur family iron response transcriptional regulator